jgi:hypothetical protein
MLQVPWWIFLISSLRVTANFLDIFSASNGVFCIYCYVSHINNLDIFSVVSLRLVFIFSWCPILSILRRSSKGLLPRYIVGRLKIKFLSSLSGDSLSIITIFSRASHCELFRCFVGNFMTNFLEILSSVPIFFNVWRRIISIFHLASHGEHFDILSNVLTRYFSGTSQSIILIFCRVSHGGRHPNTLKSITPRFTHQNSAKTLPNNLKAYIVSPGNFILCSKEKLWMTKCWNIFITASVHTH